MIAESGWRASFVYLGLMNCLLGIPAACLLRPPPYTANALPKAENAEPTGDPMATSQNDWHLFEAFKTLPFQVLFWIFASQGFTVGVVSTHLVAHMEDIGISPVQASFSLTLIGASGIFGRIMMGGIADKVPNRVMLAAGLFPQAFLMLWLIWAREIWAFYAFAALFGMTYGGTMAIMPKVSSEMFGLTSAAGIFGLLIFGATIGVSVGAPISGHVYDMTERYSIAFLVGALIMTAAFLSSIVVKPPVKRS
jgi:predicted MFS family arabinose efflux permease